MMTPQDDAPQGGDSSVPPANRTMSRQRTPKHTNMGIGAGSTSNRPPTSPAPAAASKSPGIRPRNLPPNPSPIAAGAYRRHDSGSGGGGYDTSAFHDDENDSYNALEISSLTPRSMLSWRGSFDDQSVETLTHALDEIRHVDDDPFAEVNDARPILPKIAFFLGDLRDGLAMINMQSLFLVSKSFTQKQVGSLLFAFGMSQVVFMAPFGFLMDRTTGKQKLRILIGAGISCSVLTVLTAMLANSGSMGTLVIIKILQGAATAFQPPGINSITLGIVGATGFTRQVSRNIMMRHVGTAIFVAIASLMAYVLYPNIGSLFAVSLLFCGGFVHYLRRIKPSQIDADAARGLIERSKTMEEYELADETNEALWKALQQKRLQESQNVDGGGGSVKSKGTGDGDGGVSLGLMASQTVGADSGYVPPTPTDVNARSPVNRYDSRTILGINSTESLSGIGSTPLRNNCSTLQRDDTPDADNNAAQAIQQPKLDFIAASSPLFRETSERIREAISPFVAVLNRDVLMFCGIVFGFHLSNSAVLPLVMHAVQLEDPQSGVLLSGLCILLAQSVMMVMSKIVGDYSPLWGRKKLFLIALFSLPVRCFVLSTLTAEEERVASAYGRHICKILILSTQLFDAVGAGIFGTLYILITNDLSIGTGRFSLLLGISTAAMCLGCTFSSAIGAVLAEDFGYDIAFNVLGLIALVPAFVCLFSMPETLPDYVRPKKKKKRRRKLADILKMLNLGTGDSPSAATNAYQPSPTQKHIELV